MQEIDPDLPLFDTMALEAGESTILTLVLGKGMKQLGLGMVFGLAAALAVCRLMARPLFMVSPNDPITFVSVALILGAASRSSELPS